MGFKAMFIPILKKSTYRTSKAGEYRWGGQSCFNIIGYIPVLKLVGKIMSFIIILQS